MGIGKPFGSSSDQADKPKNGLNYRKNSWYQCQCSCCSQIPSQDDLKYHQFLSFYKISQGKLIVYDTEKEKKEVKNLHFKLIDDGTCITQLPNGELFCYGSYESGIALIIDRSYKARKLPLELLAIILQLSILKTIFIALEGDEVIIVLNLYPNPGNLIWKIIDELIYPDFQKLITFVIAL